MDINISFRVYLMHSAMINKERLKKYWAKDLGGGGAVQKKYPMMCLPVWAWLEMIDLKKFGSSPRGW